MAVVRLDKIQSAYNGNLESIVHTADMTNGLFFLLGDLVTGERELRDVLPINESAIATSLSTSEEVVFHASPEVMYDEVNKRQLKDFLLKIGNKGRAYHFAVGDIITLTDDLFTSTPTVNQYVVIAIDGTMKLRPSTDKTVLASDGVTSISPRLVFEVIEQTTLGSDTAFALQVVNS